MRYKVTLTVTVMLFFIHCSFATIFYVNTNGNDTTGDGSASKPWRTLRYAVAKVPANQGHIIRMSAGTFVEDAQIEIPPGVSIEGAGKHLTIIQAASSFYYNPANPGYAAEKFLLSLKAQVESEGNQSLKHFTIDGDSKQLHGGIYVRYRNHVIIDDLRIQNTNFNGIWFWDVKDSKIRHTELINCSWGSTGYCAGALHLGNVERVEIDHLDVNESVGYGIKAIGPTGENNIRQLKIHDSRISVNAVGLWNDGLAPNIAVELWNVNLVACEIYNSYVDNTISLVNSNSPPSTGIQTIRVHHNTIDMETRAKGAGYGVELSIHDAEVDHNYFIKGSYGIANWDNPVKNWNIHHNVFYALEGVYPGDIVRSQKSGLHNVNFYNNTVEFSGEKTINVIGLYGGTSENVNVINNLFINNNTGYSYYPNALVHLENNAGVKGLVVKNNFFDRLPVGQVPGAYSDNLEGDPKIYKSGDRPDPFYRPTPKSPLRDAGSEASLALPAMTDDLGAFEYDESLFNQPPQVQMSRPENNSTSYEGSPVTLAANASDSTGSIARVEFYDGGTKLAEDVSNPYAFAVRDLKEGNHSFTAVATDNYGAKSTSTPVNFTVMPTVKLWLYAPSAKLSGHTVLTNDSTASKGSYFSIPSGNGTNYTLGASAAQFNFDLQKTDAYVLWVRVRAPGPDNQAYYIYDGKGNWTTWMAGVHEDWTWVKVTDAYTNSVAKFPFSQGANLLVFSWLHENVHVDQALVTNNPEYIPSTKNGISLARTATTTADKVPLREHHELHQSIIVFPNPAKDDFTITYESPVAQQAEIKIITLMSLIVKRINVDLRPGQNQIKLHTDNLANGIYFVSLVTSTGETAEVKTAISK